MHFPLRSTLTVAAFGLLVSATPVLAESVAPVTGTGMFEAILSGVAEVPPNEEAGTGMLEATLDTDTNELIWSVIVEGLTGDPTAAHFHGPAEADENASPVLPVEGDLATSLGGSATLTDEQAADLEAGLWYFNIHTEQYPDGELRGQVLVYLGEV
ncbi:MAG: CHRD domain-containing protein [Gammaproteobacteria bacterium]